MSSEMTDRHELLATVFFAGFIFGLIVSGWIVNRSLTKQVDWWREAYCHVTPHELEFCNEQ
jgi:uncharacterized membrane protein YciS (DUF1049 family)